LDELFHGIQRKGSPSAPVNSLEEVLSSPQFEARGFLTEVDHPEAGTLKYPTAPYHFSKTPWSVERPAPMLGQHNEEVFGRYLGYSRQDLIKLREAGII